MADSRRLRGRFFEGGYLSCLAIGLLARTSFIRTDIVYISEGQRVLWSWHFAPVFIASVLIAAACARRAGLLSPRETLGGPAQQWCAPIFVGTFVGLLVIAADNVMPAAAVRGVSTVHVTGWKAVPFYGYGALLLSTGSTSCHSRWRQP